MLCDERIRSMTMRHADAQPRPDLRHAELVRVSRCPARPGFRELHFAVAGMPWSWCFPPSAPGAAAASRREKLARAQAGLVLRPGPHGLLAEPVAGAGQRRPAAGRVDLASAADLAIAGTAIFVHCSLLGSGAAGDGRDGLWPAAGGDGAAG